MCVCECFKHSDLQDRAILESLTSHHKKRTCSQLSRKSTEDSSRNRLPHTHRLPLAAMADPFRRVLNHVIDRSATLTLASLDELFSYLSCQGEFFYAGSLKTNNSSTSLATPLLHSSTLLCDGSPNNTVAHHSRGTRATTPGDRRHNPRLQHTTPFHSSLLYPASCTRLRPPTADAATMHDCSTVEMLANHSASLVSTDSVSPTTTRTPHQHTHTHMQRTNCLRSSNVSSPPSRTTSSWYPTTCLTTRPPPT
jgi:hypothetical protein